MDPLGFGVQEDYGFGFVLLLRPTALQTGQGSNIGVLIITYWYALWGGFPIIIVV